MDPRASRTQPISKEGQPLLEPYLFPCFGVESSQVEAVLATKKGFCGLLFFLGRSNCLDQVDGPEGTTSMPLFLLMGVWA